MSPIVFLYWFNGVDPLFLRIYAVLSIRLQKMQKNSDIIPDCFFRCQVNGVVPLLLRIYGFFSYTVQKIQKNSGIGDNEIRNK